VCFRSDGVDVAKVALTSMWLSIRSDIGMQRFFCTNLVKCFHAREREPEWRIDKLHPAFKKNKKSGENIARITVKKISYLCSNSTWCATVNCSASNSIWDKNF
jgi:hypothetical protein